MPALPRKVAVAREHTGSAAQDRSQRVAQRVAQAHEQTKAVVTDITTRVGAIETGQAAESAAVDVLERNVGQGRLAVSMANSNITLTASQAAQQVLVLTGANTAVRTVSYPDATDATAYIRWVVNITTGGFPVTVKTVSGGVASVANGATKAVLMSNAATSVLT